MSRYVDDVEMFGCGKADCVKIPEKSYFLTRKLFYQNYASASPDKLSHRVLTYMFMAKLVYKSSETKYATHFLI